MPWYRIGGALVHLHMDKRARKKAAPPCPFWVYAYAQDEHGRLIEKTRVRCLAPAGYLCDWIGCDVPICERHREQLLPGFDFCPTHNSRRGLFSRLLPAPTNESNHA